MALGTLGDLEELEATLGRPSAKYIFQQGVTSARHYYKNHHVYPHTYLGAFHYRCGLYKEALKNWRIGKLQEPPMPEVVKNYDLVVTGGGLAGAAARHRHAGARGSWPSGSLVCDRAGWRARHGTRP